MITALSGKISIMDNGVLSGNISTKDNSTVWKYFNYEERRYLAIFQLWRTVVSVNISIMENGGICQYLYLG